MKKRVVLAVLFGTLLSGVISFFLFYLVTTYLVDPYIKITGELIHHNIEENKALLHLVSQGSILGGLGGVLYVLQLLTNYIGTGEIPIVKQREIQNYFLYAFMTPTKGLIAGLIAATVIGGVISFFTGIDALRRGHLFIIGCSCIAGYSEQFLQRVVDLASRRVKQV